MKTKNIILGIAGVIGAGSAMTGDPEAIPVAVATILLAVGGALDRDGDGIPDFVERIRNRRKRRKRDQD